MKDIIYEIIGSILIVRDLVEESKLLEFSKRMMKKYPSIQTVVIQTSKVGGVERTREFEYYMGKDTFETLYKEYGNIFLVNISTSFFSPRLSYERERIAKMVKKGEIILNFFSGVGPFSISIATKCNNCIIHSIEINENAHQYLLKNIELNKCKEKVKAYLGDAFDIVPQLFFNKVDRVLLPLPLEAEHALPLAYHSLKKGRGIIHWQITEKVHEKEITLEQIKQNIQEILDKNHIDASFYVETLKNIRWVAPRIAHKAIDLVFN